MKTAELTAALQEALQQHFGRPFPIARLERRPYAYQTSFPLHEVNVVQPDGTTLPLLVKEVSRQALPTRSRQAKPAFLHDPLREIVVYRQILDSAALGTPVCYGAISDAPAGRFWLFLEKVRGIELYQVGERAVWQEAARWLAALHTRFAGATRWQNRTEAAHLLRHDAAYYRLWMQRARQFAQTAPRGPAHSGLDRIARHYEHVVERLLALPMTLIHGEFYASNVLVQQRTTGVRISPVDWEMAALGPGLIDLAALVAGKWTEEDRRAMALAYHDACAALGNPSPSIDEMMTALDTCRLHLAVQWLGWSADWVPPPEHGQDWLGEALGLADKLGLE